MKLKLTASTVWNVAPADEEMAREMMEKKPVDTIIGYLSDATYDDAELEKTRVEVEELK